MTPVTPMVASCTNDAYLGRGDTDPVLAIIGLLPTPELRTAVFLATLHTPGRPTLSPGTHQMSTVSFPDLNGYIRKGTGH